jgi:hypothetical protein
MALDFDVSKIKDHKNLTTDPEDPTKWSLPTQAMVWLTMAVGIPEVTRDNAADFLARSRMYERMFGPMRGNEAGPVYLEAQEVVDHIGLSTNAVPMTKPEFRQAVMARLIQAADHEIRTIEARV